jgi:dTDP-glucose 4,6-dehydratase
MIKILLTGAAGFAGSHLAEELLFQHDAVEIISLDRLTYAGRLDRLAHLDQSRIRTIYHDLSAELPQWMLDEIGSVDYIIHNAACTHVLRSFTESEIFLRSNVIGTFNMLEAARKLRPKKFVYVSTDEVFGPAIDRPFTEDDVLAPTNPYAATKAAGEMLVRSHHITFGVPAIITRTMNMYGERQNPEKFFPMAMQKVLRGEQLNVHTNERGEIGRRQWLHARVQANAISFLLRAGNPGERYHVAGTELSNLEIAQKIANILDLPLNYRLGPPDTPTHDFSYWIDGSKLRKMGWYPPVDFEESLKQVVLWTRENQKWLE